jgi:hypothetical protein
MPRSIISRKKHDRRIYVNQNQKTQNLKSKKKSPIQRISLMTIMYRMSHNQRKESKNNLARKILENRNPLLRRYLRNHQKNLKQNNHQIRTQAYSSKKKRKKKSRPQNHQNNNQIIQIILTRKCQCRIWGISTWNNNGNS